MTARLWDVALVWSVNFGCPPWKVLFEGQVEGLCWVLASRGAK